MQAELSPAGPGPGSASTVLWYSVLGQRRRWGSHCVLPSPHAQHGELAACLRNRTSCAFLLSWMSAELGLWMWLVCWAEPWVTSEHRALYVCLLLLMLLEFAFKKSVSKLLRVETPRELNQVSPVHPLIRVI